MYPAETFHALGANALDINAARNVHFAKKRNLQKPLSVIVSDLRMCEKCTYLDDSIRKVIRKQMPGPLTVIMKKEGQYRTS